MQAGIDRLLAMQTRSGGFGYWPGDPDVHGYASAYATWVLQLASKAGYPVPELALKTRALDDLERRVASSTSAVTVDWGYYDGVAPRDRPARARRRRPRRQHARTAELFTRRQRLPLFARAFLLMALHRQTPNPRRPHPGRRAARQPAGAASDRPHQRGRLYELDEFFHSDGRSDAILLMALLRVDPDHPIVTKLARGLLERRIGGAWRNTQENAYALVALADYARIHEAEVPDFSARAWVAQRSVLDIKFKGREFVTRSAKTDMRTSSASSPNQSDPLPSSSSDRPGPPLLPPRRRVGARRRPTCPRAPRASP
jgi:hypothetical protein